MRVQGSRRGSVPPDDEACCLRCLRSSLWLHISRRVPRVPAGPLPLYTARAHSSETTSACTACSRKRSNAFSRYGCIDSVHTFASTICPLQ